MIQRSRRWRFIFCAGLAMFGIGVLAGFLAEKLSFSPLPFVFLGAIVSGAITFLVACVALGITANASSVISGGAISIFLAFLVPMTFEKLGGNFDVHDSTGVAFVLFRTVAALGGILLLAMGFVRLANSTE